MRLSIHLLVRLAVAAVNVSPMAVADHAADVTMALAEPPGIYLKPSPSHGHLKPAPPRSRRQGKCRQWIRERIKRLSTPMVACQPVR